MRVPIRKGDSRMFTKMDPVMTQEKYQALREKVEYMKKIKRPKEAEEVKRLALMGDFSENVGYQIAKGRLRGLNQRIIEIENLLSRAEIIEMKNDDSQVNLGSYVTISTKDSEKTYQILGSSETDPLRGIISHTSPIGSALLGKKLGDTINIKRGEKTTTYQITGIK